MKTIKLLEAVSSAQISTWANLWKDKSINLDDRKQLAYDILIGAGIPSDNVDKITSFGESFVNSWIDAMKIDEIFYRNNEFISILKDNRLKSAPFLENKDNFTKLYNTYVSGYLDPNWLKDKTFFRLLNDFRVYEHDQNTFKEMFSDYTSLVEQGASEEQIKDIFIQVDESGTEHINQPAQIKANIEKNNFKSKGNKKKSLDATKVSNDVKKQMQEFTKNYVDSMKQIIKDDDIIDQMVNDIKSTFNFDINI